MVSNRKICYITTTNKLINKIDLLLKKKKKNAELTSPKGAFKYDVDLVSNIRRPFCTS